MRNIAQFGHTGLKPSCVKGRRWIMMLIDSKDERPEKEWIEKELPIECDSVTRCWNKKLQKHFKDWPMAATAVFALKNEIFQNCPKSCQMFGLLFLRKFVATTFHEEPNLVTLIFPSLRHPNIVSVWWVDRICFLICLMAKTLTNLVKSFKSSSLSYKGSTIVNNVSRAISDLKIPHITTLEP